MRLRRVVLGVAALCLPLVALTVPVATGTAWALPVTGSGLVSCHPQGTGSIKYSPAWSDADSNSPITAKIKFEITGCTGGSPTPSYIKGSGTLVFTPSQSLNECTGAEEPGASGSLTLTYGHSIASSTMSGPIWVPNPTDPYLEMETGSTVVTGSYPVPFDSDVVPSLVIDEVSAHGNCTSGVKSVKLGGAALGGNAEAVDI